MPAPSVAKPIEPHTAPFAEQVPGGSFGLLSESSYRAGLAAWRERSRHETEFWRKWAVQPGYLESRLGSIRWVQGHIQEAVGAIRGGVVRLLEVGAGPITILGDRWPDPTVRVEVVAVDPLADEYNRILAEAGIVPPHPTRAIFGEELTGHFAADHFDFAMAGNCLDHSLDPLRCIAGMLTVVKPSGQVELRHHVNEAETQHGVGLHAWNFRLVGGRFVISGAAGEVCVEEALGDRGGFCSQMEGDWLITVITKRAAGPV